MLLELSELILDSEATRLNELMIVMTKLNGIMLKALNHTHKFEDRDKLLYMCVAYIEVIEKLTDLEKFKDDTFEERRQKLILPQLLQALKMITHLSFPLNEVMIKEAGTIDILLRLLLRRIVELYKKELTC